MSFTKTHVNRDKGMSTTSSHAFKSGCTATSINYQVILALKNCHLKKHMYIEIKVYEYNLKLHIQIRQCTATPIYYQVMYKFLKNCRTDQLI